MALVDRFAALTGMLVVGLAAFDTAVEMMLGTGYQLISNIVAMVASFLFLKHMLHRKGLIERQGSFGRYFGASFLSSLGIVAGLILLVLPGFFLIARWALATTLAITRDLSASDALRASWAITKPSAGILMVLYIALLTLFVGAVFGTGVAAAMLPGGEDGLSFSASTNLVIDLGMMLGVVLNVAIYLELVGRQSEAEAIFA